MIRSRYFVYLGIILYFITLNTRGQDFIVEKFVSNTPFPSAELYDILEDNYGYKWIASDIGVFKVTGNQVEHYTTKNGLEENVILRFFKGLNNKIWMIGLSGTLGLIENGTIKNIKTDKSIKNLSPQRSYINSLIEKEPYSLEFIKLNGSNIYSIKRGKVTERKVENLHHVVADISSKYPFFLYPYNDTSSYTKWLITKNKQSYYFSELFKKRYAFSNIYEVLNDSISFLSNSNELVEFNSNNPKHYTYFIFPQNILSLGIMENKLYCGLRSNGLYYIENKQLYKANVSGLEKLSITKILPDTEGNIWFTTLEKGLFVARLPQAKSVYQGEVNVVKLIPQKKKINVLLANNHLLNTNNKQKLSILDESDIINDILFYEENKQLYITLQGLFDVSQSKMLTSKKTYLKGFQWISENKVAVFGNQLLYIWDTNKGITQELLQKDRIFCLEKIKDNQLWLGFQNTGIHQATFTDTKMNIKQLTNDFRVNCIKRINDNSIAVGTNDKGVIFLDNRGNLIDSIPNLPQKIGCLDYDNNTLYIGTRIGLYLYNIKSKYIKLLNNSNFLPFDEIIDVKINPDGQVYIAGKYNVISTSAIHLKNINLDIQLRINTISPNIKNNIIELEQEEHLVVNCSQNNYKAAQNIIYHFIIKQSDGHLIKYQKSKLNILDIKLQAGSYNLEIYAEDHFSLSKSNKIQIKVIVPALFYQTWWFLVLIILLVLISLWFIVLQIIRKVQQREFSKRLIQQKISNLESQALQAQMNPHFIFNAINSIQAFILQNKNEEAHFYLAEFAKLIRMILNNSRKKYVSIHDEIELLNIYVNIEAQRLNDHIAFSVNYASNVAPQEIMIPTMLLQPIIENAIWHGLNNLKKEKVIKIMFMKKDNRLMIHIFNNGKPYSQTSQSHHQSQGLKMIQERIALLYTDTEKNDYFEIQNIENGVEVTMILPLISDFE